MDVLFLAAVAMLRGQFFEQTMARAAGKLNYSAAWLVTFWDVHLQRNGIIVAE
jgi:hypothetical protein